MSIELYPTIESLDEKLSSLEDPILAARILSANPQLFPSAAAEEELSVFALAWKRFGKIALAATAVASLVAGYVVTPKLMQHPAAVPAPVVHKAPAHAIAKAPVTHKVTVPIAAVQRAAISAPAHVALPVPAPMHRAAAAPQPAVSHHVAVSHAAAAAPATQAAAAAAPVEKPLGYESNAQIVSGNQPAADMPLPNGTGTGNGSPRPAPSARAPREAGRSARSGAGNG